MIHLSDRRPARRRARGMTLIEVLCAIVIMTVGLLGLMTLMARASQATLSTEDSQRAAVLANELASEIWVTKLITPAAPTVDAWKLRVADSANMGLPNGVGTVNTVNGVTRITITWTPPDGTPRRYFTDVQLTN